MAGTPNAFPLGTLRCKKLRRGRERGRGENVGWAPRKFCCRWKKEFLIRWHRNYPSLLKSSSVSLRFLRCISTVFRTPSMSRVRVSQCVYTQKVDKRPVCVARVYRHVGGRKSFGGSDRGRKWTERTGTCCRGSVSSSRLTGKRPFRRHIKPALCTLVQFFAGRRLRFLSCKRV